MDYNRFNAEDFVTDESFQQYCLGNNAAAEAFWRNWITEHPVKKEAVEQAQALFFLLNGGITAGAYKADETAFLSRLKEKGILMDDGKAKTIRMSSRQEKKTRRFQSWMAAAAIVFVILFAGLFFFINRKQESAKLAKTNAPVPNDVAPGGDKAVLTLADGRKIILDSAANGSLTEQGGMKVIKTGGQLNYTTSGHATEVLYNTVSTPKGGQYQLLLADGSKVWLNAASSLRFPTAFTGRERVVELTGEGYFEVAHNEAAPFYVRIITPAGAGSDVQVLGTHFNVMAYAGEAAIKTTLLQGKVKVRNGDAVALLTPGQQAQATGKGEIKVDPAADVDAAVAWKNGLFQFSGADVQTIGRQIGRWYDVEVSFSGNLQVAHLSGEAPRTLNLSQVIKVLEASGIDVKTEGRKLLITPKP